MGIFDFFKPKKKTYLTDFGEFKLIRKDGLWMKEDQNKFYYVEGDAEKPHLHQIAFFNQMDDEIKRLNDEINAKLIALFQEINLPILFTDWQERFYVYAYQIYNLTENQCLWQFTIINDNPKDEDGAIDFEFLVENGRIKEVTPNA